MEEDNEACKFQPCNAPPVPDKQGYCHGHWIQAHRGYELTPILRTVQERFWARVIKKGLKDCWLWTGSTNGIGYGELRVNYKKIYAHRYSYEMHKGEIPKGLVIDHMCHTPSCVNPHHLRAVTHGENLRNQKRHNRNLLEEEWQKLKQKV